MPPGVGKTSPSLQVGADLLARFPDGARFIELAQLDRPQLVGEAVAAVFGLPVQGDRPAADAVAALLRSRRVLLILDNCEHVIAAAAKLADALLKMCPGVVLIATSREALSIAGEHAYQLPLLDVPQRSTSLTAARAMGHSAVQLFVKRAAAALGRFTLTDETAPSVVEICRRLDGIPLAIELAAPRLKVLSPETLLARLDDQLHLLTAGSRAAVPRQQTLRAAIEWSYALLSETEQQTIVTPCRVRARITNMAEHQGSQPLVGARRLPRSLCRGEGDATMNIYAPCSRLAALAGAALFFVTAATAQPTTSASVEYLMTVYLPKDATLGVDASLAISRDPEGGWVKGKVSGTILTPSADWVRIVPSDGLRLQLDGRVTIETEEHEIIYMSYNGRMHCDKETADRFRKGDALKGGDCYLVSAPTFQTKSAKYAWLNDVQAVGKMAEFKPGKGGHLIYDLFVIN